MFKDVYLGSTGSSPVLLTTANGFLFFCAADPSGQQLWRTDGSNSGTLKITTIPYENNSCGQIKTKGVDFLGWFYFIINTGHPSGNQLARTDGTPGHIELIESELSTITYSYPAILKLVGNKLFFTADASINGFGLDLWEVEGPAVEAHLVKNISPNTYGNADPQELTDFQGMLYFTANDGSVNIRKLWRSDGTSDNTVSLPSANGQTDYVGASALTVLGDHIIFQACFSDVGCELASTEGNHVKLVKNINPRNCSDLGECSSSPEYMRLS